MAIRVLILGTGSMAHVHAGTYNDMADVDIVAAVDIDQARLGDFCTKFAIGRSFSSIEEALAWGEFDAVSNVTPDAVHHPTTLPVLAAGKHVLCEKPLAANFDDAAEMTQAARRAGVVNMVNLSYRQVPALMQAAKMVNEGEIGEVRHFEAAYLQSWLTQPAWGDWRSEDQWLWRLSSAHGSMGVLGDIGVHILDFATFTAGADADRVSCRLTTFDKAPGGRIGDYVLDANDSFNMHLKLSNGAAGVVHASRMASGHHNDLTLRIFGTKGGLDVRYEHGQSKLSAAVGDDIQTATWRDVECPAVETNFARFIEAVRGDRQVLPDFARGAALQRVLDLAVVSDSKGCLDLEV